MIYPKLSDGTIDWCVMCKHEGRAVYDGCCECEYPENSDDPPTLYEPKPMTNAERIRRMTDEEMAMFLQDIWYISGSNDTSNAWWLCWLKQEEQDG